MHARILKYACFIFVEVTYVKEKFIKVVFTRGGWNTYIQRHLHTRCSVLLLSESA